MAIPTAIFNIVRFPVPIFRVTISLFPFVYWILPTIDRQLDDIDIW